MSICDSVDQFVETPRGRIFVRHWTPRFQAHLPPLVLLHDSLGCVELWRDFPEHLAATLCRPVIAYDRLGFGRSSPRAEIPSLDFIAEEARLHFPLIREALNLSDYLVLGHSVGGAMALLIAASDANCQAAISVSGQVYVEARTLEGIRAAGKAFSEPAQFEKLVRWHQEKADWVLSAWTRTWLDPDFARWDIRANLESIACPVLALHGELDEFGSPAFPEAIARHAGGQAEMELFKACGHVPHREQRARVLASITRFLSPLEPESAASRHLSTQY